MARTPLAAAAICLCVGIVAGCGNKASSSFSSSSSSQASDQVRRSTSDRRRPNVVLIFTDDLGYGDVGFQGAQDFTTPNIDWLASNGMRFTDFYVAASTYSPSRAALLTGCYRQRVGLSKVLFPGSRIGLNPNEITIAEILKALGYATAAIGKWHLGDHPQFLPKNHGFDEWFGLPYSNDMVLTPPDVEGNHFPPLPLMQDAQILETEPDQSQLTRRYTDEAVQFIRRKKNQPFFLYFAHTFPHVPLFASRDFRGRTSRGLYGDVVEEIDWSVGQVLAELDRQKLTNNTLVIFTSDNGPWLIQGVNGGSAGPLREGKNTSFEGGHRVPCVMRWPGKIQAGKVCQTMVTSMDLLPTIANLCGGSAPTDRKIDGRDVSPLLLGGNLANAGQHPFFYYLNDELQAVRLGRYKLHVPHYYLSVPDAPQPGPKGPVRRIIERLELSLFDVQADMGEQNNIAAKHPDIVRQLWELCAEARLDLGDGANFPGSGIRAPGRLR